MKPEQILDIELELTTYCNAECPLCYRNYTVFKEHYPENKVRPLNEIIEQLDQYPNLLNIRLVGSISEPTLYKHFFNLVKYIKSRKIGIEICTNGSVHKPEWWKQLSTLLTKEDEVYFTICGSTQEIHEVYRKGTSLDKILVNAKAFKSDKKNDYAQCIRFMYNSDNLDSKEFADIVSQFSNIYMTETYLHKPSENYVSVVNLDQLVPNTKKLDEYRHIDKLAKVKFESPIQGKARCMSLERKSQQIDVDGKVYPCYLFLEASKGKPWDGDYNKIVNMEYEVCKYCERCIVDLCQEKDLHYII